MGSEARNAMTIVLGDSSGSQLPASEVLSRCENLVLQLLGEVEVGAHVPDIRLVRLMITSDRCMVPGWTPSDCSPD